MGNCAASRLILGGGAGDDEDPVSLCRERKRLVKAAVERRYALAEAHASYIHSLNAVAAAIDLFVARHSAPTPILITLPSSSSSPDGAAGEVVRDHDGHPTLLSSSSPPPPPNHPPSSSAFLRHTPSEPKLESFAYRPSPPPSSTQDSSYGEGREGRGAARLEEDEVGQRDMRCEYFFSSAAPPTPATPATPAPEFFGWDFFNPFDGVRAAEEAAVMAGGINRSSDEDLRALREEEGIPELEEAEEEADDQESAAPAAESTKVEPLGANGKAEAECGKAIAEDCGSGGGEGEERGIAAVEPPGGGRELLQALRAVEDHFIRAYDAGKVVSRMLEAKRIHFQSGVEEMKENSSKMTQAIAWHGSPSSISSSGRSQLGSSSHSSTSWAETRSDLFEDYGGMESGSHSQTLGRLYAWEKKLYEEVKAGDLTRQAYEKKCLQLRNQEAKGSDSRSLDKTRAIVRDLYTRILVALRAAESISEKIQKLRDEELHPQLIELLHGLMSSWKIMLESHEAQKQIMFEVNIFNCPAYGKFSNESHRLATITLEAELRNWRKCFTSYIAAQKTYVEALDGWLSKFIMPEVECYSRARSSAPSYKAGAPPLIVICHEWYTSLGKLPDKSVSSGMRNFIKTVRFLWVKQGEEQHQKRKVDGLAKELDHRVLAFQKAENKVLESKLSENKTEPEVRQRFEYLSGRKDLLDMFRKKLDLEKEKHQDCMRETHEVTLNGFKIGLASIFESLTGFSKDAFNLYSELLKHNDKSNLLTDTIQKPSCLESSNTCLETDGDEREHLL